MGRLIVYMHHEADTEVAENNVPTRFGVDAKAGSEVQRLHQDVVCYLHVVVLLRPELVEVTAREDLRAVGLRKMPRRANGGISHRRDLRSVREEVFAARSVFEQIRMDVADHF